MHQSKTTKTAEKTLCPTWDQTLIFDEVIYGELVNNPPTVVMELFDRDEVLKSMRFSLQSCLFTITFDYLFVFAVAALFYCLLILIFRPLFYSVRDYSNLIKWGINFIFCFLFPFSTYVHFKVA